MYANCKFLPTSSHNIFVCCVRFNLWSYIWHTNFYKIYFFLVFLWIKNDLLHIFIDEPKNFHFYIVVKIGRVPCTCLILLDALFSIFQPRIFFRIIHLKRDLHISGACAQGFISIEIIATICRTAIDKHLQLLRRLCEGNGKSTLM